MKHLILIVSATIALSFSAAAVADDAYILVFDSNIVQIQDGFNSSQTAVIGAVSSDYRGRASVIVTGSNIVQVQRGNGNSQSARIGTVGCSCDGS